ncbi:RagB/SusD family nutrient uptake outer membrane protein [Zhouia spongiae]|uniref:RagB/SusD family nutrient uptake outer membrane protein n=1 Tax=Zhouia spongiae TaxID=2202721 RepID=A0ABY3YLF9_9FLAO|nr:RagB/SusD family nutrient uptake outer membrane protein [Zhouia spongiae]UNY98615.1 RagB/SusD family nutrient uptake outer membrane protein [Zhouia spongiae]
MKSLYKFRFYLTCLIVSLYILSCKDFVEIDPPNSRVIGSTVFENDRLATSAIEGVYHRMFDSGNFAGGGQWSVTTVAGLSADEFEVNPFSSSLQEFYRCDIDPSNPANLALWSSAYSTIYMVNAVMEGLKSSSVITPETKKQLEGEARFVRAFSYFYLVNLFGDVPLIITTDYRVNAKALQVSPDDIYQAIINDLEHSRQLLDDTYRNSERTHPNRLVASALLARVYLYRQEWSRAADLATELIGSTDTYSLAEDINDVFLANSSEAIWQIAPTNVGNTNEGNMFILTSSPVSSPWNPVYLKEELVSGFDNHDKRLLHWIGTFESNGTTFYYPFKYKIRLSSGQPTEYATVLRFAEQYLIRSEARARMGDIPGALADLNLIRNRSGLENYTGNSEQELLAAILKERRKEFFSEWGHRWLDFKRLSLANDLLSPDKEGWRTTDVLYPIPQRELDKAPTLNQNSGY